MCPVGEAWSYVFQQCVSCPGGTFSLSGATACTQCPDGTYSPKASSACWSSGRIGGKIRLANEFKSFYLTGWVHDLAVLLDTEVNDIYVIQMYEGSTIIDFQIEDPSEASGAGSSNSMRSMSGNEKMLLFYQWWVTKDEKLDEFNYDIINFETLIDSNGDDEGTYLFVESTAYTLAFEARPNNSPSADTSDSKESMFYFRDYTLEFDLEVVSDVSSTTINLTLLLASCILFIFIF